MRTATDQSLLRRNLLRQIKGRIEAYDEDPDDTTEEVVEDIRGMVDDWLVENPE
jgi:hypothetical protein